ncbi:hypothetical protein OC861_001201 [Tilletia horrida]|nr:hypothetical protein OC861_001201 [Tilletia horrida]
MSADHDKYAKANVDFFAKVASDYDDGTFAGGHAAGDWVRKMTKANYEAILGAFAWDEHSTELLDFACGTGLTTSLLAPQCKHVVGVDLSQPMLDQFQAKLNQQDSEPSASPLSSLASKIELVQADLLGSGEGKEKLEGRKFDVVLCTMSFHHFSDPMHATKVLSGYLKPGGKLAIVDFLQLQLSERDRGHDASHGHDAQHHHHHGHHHGSAHQHGHQHHAPHSGHDQSDPTEANFGAHSAANVIAHSSFRLADFDRFFAAAGLSRSGEPKFTRTMEWPDRPPVDVYLVIGELA